MNGTTILSEPPSQFFFFLIVTVVLSQPPSHCILVFFFFFNFFSFLWRFCTFVRINWPHEVVDWINCDDGWLGTVVTILEINDLIIIFLIYAWKASKPVTKKCHFSSFVVFSHFSTMFRNLGLFFLLSPSLSIWCQNLIKIDKVLVVYF